MQTYYDKITDKIIITILSNAEAYKIRVLLKRITIVVMMLHHSMVSIN